MTTAADFLPAILADPDDDAPRLVLADWLEETGTDPARAEFIRVQCALARLPPPPAWPVLEPGVEIAFHPGEDLDVSTMDDSPATFPRPDTVAFDYYDPGRTIKTGAVYDVVLRRRDEETWLRGCRVTRVRLLPDSRACRVWLDICGLSPPPDPHAALRRREGELLRRVGTGPCPGFMTMQDMPVMRRGFVERVTMPAAAWLAHADAIRRTAPVRHVTLTTWPDDAGDTLFAWETVLGPDGSSWHEDPERWPGVKFHLAFLGTGHLTYPARESSRR